MTNFKLHYISLHIYANAIYSIPCGNIFVLHYILRILQIVKTASNVCIHKLCVFWALDFIETHKHKHTQTEASKLWRTPIPQSLPPHCCNSQRNLVSGQYTHVNTTPLTYTQFIMTFTGTVFASSCNAIHTNRQTHTCGSGPLEDEKERGSGTH